MPTGFIKRDTTEQLSEEEIRRAEEELKKRRRYMPLQFLKPTRGRRPIDFRKGEGGGSGAPGYDPEAIAYYHRLSSDGGSISDNESTNELFETLPQEDSIEFAWAGVAGSKKRTSDVWGYYSKLYTMWDAAGTNDATQTTESLQPYVGSNIAPNENEGMKNVDGDGRYVEHPGIIFADNEAWSVSTVMNFNGSGLGSNAYYTGDINYGIGLYFGSYSYRFRNPSNILTTLYEVESRIGKFSIVTFVADGEGTLNLYVDGVLIDTHESSNTAFNFKYIISGYRTTMAMFGLLSAHIIHSTALTLTEIEAMHSDLANLYPEIPSVTIGTDDVATSNFEAVASTDGTFITEATDDTDWATGAVRWCYHSDDLATGAIYGKLYNKAARDVIIANPPSGWHVATEAELTALAANGGNALKVGGTDYWSTAGGTNSTGFTALGGSFRNASGTFATLKETSCFWCADSDKVLELHHDNNTAEVVAADPNGGFSIRLVKD